MKKSIKCPHCEERIRTFNVPVNTFFTFNPSTYKIGKRVGDYDFDTVGFCPKCSGTIDIEMFEEDWNKEDLKIKPRY